MRTVVLFGDGEPMITVTRYDATGGTSTQIALNTDHLVSYTPANPSGTVISMVRGDIHVAQSFAQITALLR
tara:strand:+ start:1378 stop:1590 length:213 start_codon:yes stop_codon:yes gene_type:complete